MPKYEKLDALILRSVEKNGPVLAARLGVAVRNAAEKVADQENLRRPEARHVLSWRITERRLQALRTAGKIRYQRKPEGWVLASGAEA